VKPARTAGFAVTCLLASCLSASLSVAATQIDTWRGAPQGSALERCLLERLEQADAATPVGSIRAACSELASEAQAASAPIDLSIPSVLLPETGRVAFPELPGGPVERRIVSEARLWRERFALLPHRPNYLLPVTHSRSTLGSDGDPVQRNEIKFQVSFKFPLLPPLFEDRAALFFAYTGQAWWQAYFSEQSAPFREYSHEPELFFAWRPDLGSFAGWTPRLATAGINHQSNGRRGELSRSWNRVFAEFSFDRPDGWWASIKPWWRIPEDAKTDPASPKGDDNPDIQRYAGDAEFRIGHAGGLHHWTLTARRGLRDGGKGSVQLDWSRPTGFSPQLRWYAQYFDGYGESLLDARTRIRRLGVGVMLNDWY
jgi:phospholipase A1